MPQSRAVATHADRSGSSSLPPIQHIVVIVQENRAFNTLFMGFPGATTARYGRNSSGQTVALHSVRLATDYDIGHIHAEFKTEYAGGAMNGWNKERLFCRGRKCPARSTVAYAYVKRSDIQPYWQMASQYTVADQMFQSNEGPSFPAHQYLVSGTSTIANGSDLRASENAKHPPPHGGKGEGMVGGCDSKAGSTVKVINDAGGENETVFPCFDRLSIFDELDAAGLSWRYYQYYGGAGVWNAVDALKPIWQKPEFTTDVVWPPSRVLTDIANGQLAAVTFVTPTYLESDHALDNNGTGPSWVASVVNAIGTSPFWSSTAIFVTWDDWGGWFDPVTPTIQNSYEQGFRVPLIVISPYAKEGYVSHTPHAFGSILRFTEEEFGLPSMGTTDSTSDDLSDCFGRSASRRFKPIHAARGAAYFLRQPTTRIPPDDD